MGTVHLQHAGNAKGLGAPRGPLKLPVEETSEPPLPPACEWASVTRFSAHQAGDDWSPAVQAAIDSGARVVYRARMDQYTSEASQP